jgi:hypothetical protein
METAYSFECQSCGYSTEVCGETDSGFGATVRSSVCGDCNAVVDVLIGGSKFFGGKPEKSDNPDVWLCPDCKGRNVAPWKRSGRAPNVRAT